MADSLPREKKEYTPEQRRLLGRAYRMILSWSNNKTSRSTQVGMIPVHPSENVVLPLEEKQR